MTWETTLRMRIYLTHHRWNGAITTTDTVVVLKGEPRNGSLRTAKQESGPRGKNPRRPRQTAAKKGPGACRRRRSFGGLQTRFNHKSDEIGHVINTQLSHQLGPSIFDGSLANTQSGSDVFIRLTQ